MLVPLRKPLNVLWKCYNSGDQCHRMWHNSRSIIIHSKPLEEQGVRFRLGAFPFPREKKKTHRPSDSARLTEPGNACSQLLSEILNHWSELWRFQVLLKTLLQLVLITSSNVTTRGDEEGSLLAVSIFFCQLRHRCEDEHVRVSSTHSNTNRKEFGRLHYRQLHRKPARWRIYRNILVYHLLQIIIEVIVHVYNKMNNSIERFLQI